MQNIVVRRYHGPITEHWQGWVEPDDLAWILFVAADGTVTMFDERDPETGAVL